MWFVNINTYNNNVNDLEMEMEYIISIKICLYLDIYLE